MTYDFVKDLPLSVDRVELDQLRQKVSSDFARVTTVVHLRGDGEEGAGEDVTYSAELHDAFPELNLAGTWTFDSLSQHLDGAQLFTVEPDQRAYVDYRRWALESAALDLTLRQNGHSLAGALRRQARPVTFVASMRIDSIERLEQWIGLYPGLRLKLDPTSEWSDELMTAVAALGRVDVVDLKGQYKGTVVDQAADPRLYERVAEAFPGAWIEDPNLDDEECDRVLRPHRERITWDAPIHSVEDIEGLPFAPRTINVKPSRFGSVRKLLDAYDYCELHGIETYGGGQFELGPGRGHIQHFASIFSPGSPNDVAPGGYNAPPAPGLPESPLPPPSDAPGLGYR